MINSECVGSVFDLEVGNLGRLQLKLKLVSDQGDKFSVEETATGVGVSYPHYSKKQEISAT